MKCLEVDECNINLSGEESYDLDNDIASYHWDFGNGETSTKENPPSVKYGTGEYAITLRVTDKTGLSSEQFFSVSVSGKHPKEKTPLKPLDENVFSLKITSANPNPIGSDNFAEWAEITNPLGVNISLAGCSLDDDVEKGSDPYIFEDSTLIRAHSSKRFYKFQTLLNLNNTGDSVNLVCGGKLVSNLSWNYSIPEGFIVSQEIGLLQYQDENTLSDLLELAADDENISSEKLDIMVFENLFVFDDESVKKSISKAQKITEIAGIKSIEDIHISLQ